MKIFGLLFLSCVSAFQGPLKVIHGVTTKNKWYSIITNKSLDPVTTRIKGEVVLHDWDGNVYDTFSIPLGGVNLEHNQSCMTEIHIPLPDYGKDKLVILTCKMDFPEIKKQYRDSMFYRKNNQF